MAPLKGGIVGFGQIAALGHWPAYAASTDVEIVAVAESSPQRRQAASALHPQLHLYDGLGALLAQERLDFVDLCTPPASHVALAEKCLRHGLHVLCEKPLALRPADHAALAETASRAGKTLFTVHNWKHAPIFQEAFNVLHGGALGAPWRVDLFTLRDTHCKGAADGAASSGARAEDWRRHRALAGGGILVDHGWHAFYLTLGLLSGASPKRLRAKLEAGSTDTDALEETAQLWLEFPHATASIFLSWRSSVRRNAALVHAEKGTLFIDDDRLVLMPHQGPSQERVFPALSAGSHHSDWFPPVLSAFLDEVRNLSRRGANLREAGWCAALTAAAYESGRRQGQEVAVSFPSSSSAATGGGPINSRLRHDGFPASGCGE